MENQDSRGGGEEDRTNGNVSVSRVKDGFLASSGSTSKADLRD